MTFVIDKTNRPSLLRWAIGFLLGTYFSTSKASPNDSKIVIIVIIVVGEEMRVQHSDGIIAQRNFFGRASFRCRAVPGLTGKHRERLITSSNAEARIHAGIRQIDRLGRLPTGDRDVRRL